MKKLFCSVLLITTLIFIDISNATRLIQDPLPSWNEGSAKTAILNFVRITTDKKNPHYVPPTQRLATFDQDGTLWVEYPIYTQVLFALDQIITLAPQHPEWKNLEPFKSIIAGNKAAIAKFTAKDLEKIVVASHAGLSVDDFKERVNSWLAKTNNTRWHRPYTELVYQPMLEVLNLLRANGYKTYIVTGGGQDFVRAYSERVYGIPPEQVIGSALQTQYSYDKKKNGVLIKTPKLLLNDDFSGKPEDIYLFMGRAGQAAFGNSVGDQQMLEYTEANPGAHLMMLVHHDDAKREYAYDEKAKVGKFSNALASEAAKQGWHIISIKKDWKRVFRFQSL